MNFEIEIISQEEFKRQYRKPASKITRRSSTYKPLTAKEREQRDADRAYHRNWKNSIRMPKGKSQRIADLNNRYYN